MKTFIKLSILLCTSFFMTQLSFGKDIAAVTSDGKTVVLHDNGKWEFTSSIPEGAILLKFLGTRHYNNVWCNFKFELTNNTGQDIERIYIGGKLLTNFDFLVNALAALIAIIIASVPELVNLKVSKEGILSQSTSDKFIKSSTGPLNAVPLFAWFFNLSTIPG